ncbi:MAG: hypothetical protein D6795_04165, partial [Deltaproteobacteria bacterium]
HPNVCKLYDTIETAGERFLVMEFIEGETLQERIAREGPLPVQVALPIFLEIVEALDFLHRQCPPLLHRDLKPHNVMLSSSGRVKLIDFGLARPMNFPKQLADSNATTRREEQLSDALHQMGTPAYMAPESFSSPKESDPRSDLFSLGVTMFEAMTSVRPFQGRSEFQIASAILNEFPPPPSRLRSGVPPRMEYIILRLLEKDRRRRFQSAAEVKAQLLAVGRDLERPSYLSDLLWRSWRRYHLSFLPWLSIWFSRKRIFHGIVLSSLVAYFLLWMIRSRHPLHECRVSACIEEEIAPGEEFALSRDDRVLIHVDETGHALCRHDLSTGKRLLLATLPQTIYHPAFSAAERRIYFATVELGEGGEDADRSREALWEISPLGGEARLLLEDAGDPTPAPDGRTFLFTRKIGRFYRIHHALPGDLAGARPIPMGESGHQGYPSWAPDGRRFVFHEWEGTRASLWIYDTGREALRRLTAGDFQDTYPAWSPDGKWIYFVSNRSGDRQVWRITPSGRFLQQVTTNEGVKLRVLPLHDGAALLYASRFQSRDLFLLDLHSGREIRLTTDTADDNTGVWSPDGGRIAFISRRGKGYAQLWFLSVEGGEPIVPPRLLTPTKTEISSLAWSPDGASIGYIAREGDTSVVRAISPQNGSIGEIAREEGNCDDLSWDPTNRRIVMICQRENAFFLTLFPLGNTGRRESPHVLRFGSPVQQPRFSPDGTRIAFSILSESWKLRIWEGGSTVQEPIDDAFILVDWNEEGIWGICLLPERYFCRIDPKTFRIERGLSLSLSLREIPHSFHLSKDGRHLLFDRDASLPMIRRLRPAPFSEGGMTH